MNAKELYTQDGKPTGIYFCGECKTVNSVKERMDKCCACHECGNKIIEPKHGFQTICYDCQAKRAERNNLEKLRKAVRVEKPTTDYIYTDDIDRNEGYMTLGELYDAAEVDDIPVPCYVFDCNAEHWRGVDIDNYLDDEFSDWYEDAQDNITDYEELSAFITEWNKKQSITQYIASDNRVYVIDEDRFNKLIGELEQINTIIENIKGN